MGMAAYEKNTGKLHPLSRKNRNLKTSSKRSTGGVPLVDYFSFLWYGNISIGTPSVDYTGMILSFGSRVTIIV